MRKYPAFDPASSLIEVPKRLKGIEGLTVSKDDDNLPITRTLRQSGGYESSSKSKAAKSAVTVEEGIDDTEYGVDEYDVIMNECDWLKKVGWGRGANSKSLVTAFSIHRRKKR